VTPARRNCLASAAKRFGKRCSASRSKQSMTQTWWPMRHGLFRRRQDAFDAFTLQRLSSMPRTENPSQ
jgi:hypothetical protein